MPEKLRGERGFTVIEQIREHRIHRVQQSSRHNKRQHPLVERRWPPVLRDELPLHLSLPGIPCLRTPVPSAKQAKRTNHPQKHGWLHWKSESTPSKWKLVVPKDEVRPPPDRLRTPERVLLKARPKLQPLGSPGESSVIQDQRREDRAEAGWSRARARVRTGWHASSYWRIPSEDTGEDDSAY